MSKTYSGGPAFPADSVPTGDGGRTPQLYSGMTLRDYFAAMAMHGALMHEGADNIIEPKMAKWAYQMADAMLEARSE